MRVRASSSPDSRAHSSRSRASSCGASPRASVVSICASSSEYCCARSIARVCTLARRSSRLSESQQSGCGQPSAPLPPPARHLLNATLEPAQCARRSDGASVGGIHHPAAGATASPTANSALNGQSICAGLGVLLRLSGKKFRRTPGKLTHSRTPKHIQAGSATDVRVGRGLRVQCLPGRGDGQG